MFFPAAASTGQFAKLLDEAVGRDSLFDEIVGNSYHEMHLSLVRHGGVFQVIDPWLTSWYVGLAIETFVRDIALGDTVGQAFTAAHENLQTAVAGNLFQDF